MASHGFDEAGACSPTAACVIDNGPFPPLNLKNRCLEVGHRLDRNYKGAMLIHLKEVARSYYDPFDDNGLSEIGNVDIGVRNAEMTVQRLKTGSAHLIDVADPTVRHSSYAT